MTEDDAGALIALQRAASRKYVGGAPGVAVSGLVWTIAGLIAANSGISPAFTVLFFGGMIIFPLSVLIARLIAPTESRTTTVAMDRLGLESTAILFAGLLLAYLLLERAPDLVFPAAALAIGVRYFVFRTLYGDAIYWVLGALIVAAAAAASFSVIRATALPVAVGLIEIGMAIVIGIRWRKAVP